jgi:hypothetical protein
MVRLKTRLSQDTLTEVFLFFVLLVSYAYFFPRWADPNQNSRLDMVVAVVDDGTFQIDRYVSNTVDYARVGDHYYSDKAPGAAFLGIPVYWGVRFILDLPLINNLTGNLANNQAFKSTLNPEGTGIFEEKVRFAIAQVVISFVVASLPTAVLGILIFKILKNVSPNIFLRLGVSLTYGLLTPVLAYAGAFYGHQLSAMLLFWAFFIVFTKNPLTKRSLLGIGFLLGYSIITEYPAVLIAAGIGVYILVILLKRGRLVDIFWLAPLGVCVLIAWMVYNQAVFGGPLTLGYSESELWTSQHQTGFMSLSSPTLEAFWGTTFGRFRGLFFYSPITLLFLPGFLLWWRSGAFRKEWFLSVYCITAMFLFNSASVMWWGGFAIGPRYILPMLPFLAMSWIYPFIYWKRNRLFWWVVSLLCLWSFTSVWGLTLAGRSFPPDSIYDPLVDYALPNWLSGNVARNIGTIFGFRGASSLLPLFLVYIGLAVVFFVARQRLYLSKMGTSQLLQRPIPVVSPEEKIND